MSTEIEAAEQRVIALREQLSKAEKELRALREEAAPFHVGDIAETNQRGNCWEPVIVRVIDARSWGTWYSVSFKKKNGEWSSAVRNVFSDLRAPEAS